MTTTPTPPSEDSRLEQAKAILGKVSVQAQPRILIEINRMARSDDVNFDLIADLVAQDVGLSAKLLKLASSPLHSRGQKFNSVHEALMAIGLEDFRVCFTSVSLSDFMGKVGYPYKGFLEHSQRVSVICKEIAELLSPRHANHAYTLGLFHDVGAVLIPLYQRSYVEHIQRTLPLYFGITELEYNLVGTNHCAVGELFGQTWGLSADILMALRYHHRPENDSLSSSTAVTLKMILQLAELLNDKLTNNDDRIAPFSGSKDTLATIYTHFELTPDDLLPIEKQVRTALSQKMLD
jgi:HD-like signal output (HDOD) protein